MTGHAQQGEVEKGRKERGRWAEHLADLPEGGRSRPGTLAERAPTGCAGRPLNSWTNVGRILDVGTMAKSQKDADG